MRSWWAKSASLVALFVLFGAVAVHGRVREGQGLAVAQCTASSFVTGYPAGDNTGFCAQPATGNLSDVQNGATCSWTPNDASGAGLTFTSVSETCTQIGNIYFISGRLTYPSTANGSTAQIGGLPATVVNKTGMSSPTGGVITTAALSLDPVPQPNTTTFELFSLASTGGVTNAQLSSATVIFGFWYSTN